MPNREFIMVTPSGSMPFRDGFHPGDPAPVLESLPFAFHERTPELESSSVAIQIIPYVMVRLSVTDRVYLMYRRGGASAEGRLRARWSLGFGGHVRESDAFGLGPERRDWDTIRAAAARELAEEIGQDVPMQAPEWLGLIYDPSDPVGRVHLGVIGRITLHRIPARFLESPGLGHEHDAHRLVSFPPDPAQAAMLSDMNIESWSKIIMSSIESGRLRA